MDDLSGYHLFLVSVGMAMILAYWLPRFVSGREPAASALLIGLGFLTLGWNPELANSLNPVTAPRAWEIASELCLIVGLFGVGMRIDRLAQPRRWSATLRLLLLTMPLTILGLMLLGWTAGGMTLAGALLQGSVLAPTDPVLAGDVQVGRPTEGGEHPVRFTLTTEAGLNDGLAFPFVHLSLAVAAVPIIESGLVGEWLLRDVLYRIVVGALCGVAIGWLLGKLLFEVPRRNALAKTQAGVMALAGVLVTYGLTELAEGYGFVAAFLTGVTLRRSETRHEFHVRLHDFAETIEHALTAVLLIALGASLPAVLRELTVPGALIALALILIIRPATGLVALIGTPLPARDRVVVAAYGVRGVGSIYYLSYAGSRMELTNEGELWAIVSLAILASTILHGFTAAAAVEQATGERQTN